MLRRTYVHKHTARAVYGISSVLLAPLVLLLLPLPPTSLTTMILNTAELRMVKFYCQSIRHIVHFSRFSTVAVTVLCLTHFALSLAVSCNKIARLDNLQSRSIRLYADFVLCIFFPSAFMNNLKYSESWLL